MFKVAETAPHAFQILHFPVDGFDGTIGEPAVVDTAGSDLFHHDKRCDDRLPEFFQERGKFPEHFMSAGPVSDDELFQFCPGFGRETGILLVELDIKFFQVAEIPELRVDTEQGSFVVAGVHQTVKMRIHVRVGVVFDV